MNTVNRVPIVYSTIQLQMLTKWRYLFITVLWTLLALGLWGGSGVDVSDEMVPVRVLRPPLKLSSQSFRSNYSVVPGSHNSSYVLALTLQEQLSAASHSMFEMAPLAADWNAQLVEPVVLKSRIFGIEGIFPPDSKLYTGQTSIKLSEIYDISEVRRILQTHVSPPVNMVPFEEFLATASRTVTLLHFVRFGEGNMDFVLNRTESDLVRRHFITSNSTAPFDCTHMSGASQWARKVETKLNKKSRKVCPVFAVERVLCFEPTLVYRTDVMLQHMSHPGTIVFTDWRGCGIKFGSLEHNSELHTNPNSFRYAVLSEASMKEYPIKFEYRLHNPGITKVAEDYLETLNKRPPFLSIHIRTERLVRDALNLTCCLESLKQMVDKLSNLSETLLITDVGSEYGTMTCGRRCEHNVHLQLFLSKLPSFNLTVSSYDPKLLNGTENSAYVSLVEMNMLSMGDKLVLVGRGGFQAILKDKFLSLNHTEEDVYHICNGT